MTAAAVLLVCAGALLALSIHLVMPLYGLMVVRVVVFELAAYLVIIEIAAALVALAALRDAARVAVLAVAAGGQIALAAILRFLDLVAPTG